MLQRRTLLAAPALLASVAQAQGWAPDRPVSIVVPTAAGGGTDFAARLIAEPLGRLLGQPVVVENRPGGNDTVGMLYAMRARPDGHTLLMGYCGTMAGKAALRALGEVDPQRDFTPIGQVTDTPQLFTVHPSLPVQDLRGFVAYAKQRPGQLTYASAGNGSFHHLGTELLKARAGIDLLHVPYRGTGETIGDLVAGRVHFYMNSPPPLLPLVRDGKLRAVSVSSDARHPLIPEVPSLVENGFSGFPLNVWFGLFAPAAVPPPALARLEAALQEVLADGGLRSRAGEAGAIVSPSSAAALRQRVDREVAGWREIAQAAGIRAD